MTYYQCKDSSKFLTPQDKSFKKIVNFLWYVKIGDLCLMLAMIIYLIVIEFNNNGIINNMKVCHKLPYSKIKVFVYFIFILLFQLSSFFIGIGDSGDKCFKRNKVENVSDKMKNTKPTFSVCLPKHPY